MKIAPLFMKGDPANCSKNTVSWIVGGYGINRSMSSEHKEDISNLRASVDAAQAAVNTAQAREREAREETEFVLACLRELGDAENLAAVYDRALDLLRDEFGFDEAFIVRAPFTGESYSTVATTHEAFASVSLVHNTDLETVKAGKAVHLADMRAVPWFAELPGSAQARMAATLLIPIPQDIGAMAIICTTEQRGGLAHAPLQAAQRFGWLVAQALRTTRVREDELQSALVRLSSQAERDQTDFMLAAVDALGEGVFVVDAQQRIIVTNERYRQLYHELADMYVPGLNIEEIWLLERQSGFVTMLDLPEDAAINKAEGWLGTTRTDRHSLRDGRTIRATDRRLPNGWIVGVRVDISELAQKERDLTVARNQAQAASAVKTEFLATVSHEIRTPLNAILGMLGLIRRDQLSDSQHEYVSVATTSARNLLMLLNDILDVSKMEAGKLMLEDEDVILAQLVREVVQLYQDAADAKALKLTWALDPNLPVAVRADGGRLRQVLINFVSNAIKFTDHGWVNLSLQQAEAQPRENERVRLRFSVQDTGAGISETAQERLFQAFEQVGASVEKRQGGTGLGLNICHRIAEAMDGETGADSSLGRGSTFWFEAEFPIASVLGYSHAPALNTEEPRQEVRGDDALRILVADDSPSNQLLIRAMLRPTGHHLDIVSDGLEAVRAVETLPYDVVFLDISMPEMDGREALAEILQRQQDGQLARQELDPTVLPLSIVAITANVMKGDREKFMRDGFSEVIAKPFNEKDLLDAIEAHAPHQRQLNRPAVVVRTDTLSDSDVAVPEPGDPQAIDQSVLDRLLETFGADFFSTSISIFTDEIDGRMMLLGNPSVSLDVTRREAHAIKGSSASYGLTALSALAAQLEETPERRETALSQMHRHWDHARVLLKSKCL